MANAYFYTNTAVQTTLSGSISAGATSLNVAATTGFPGSFPYVLALDYGAATEELVAVTNAAGTTLTVTRGFGGTSAQTHSLSAVVRHVVNAQDLTDFRTHEAATSSVHGVTGALVGATSTQTLTNKTLTSPTINGGALSGTFTGTPTFSGGMALTAAVSLSGASLTVTRALTTNPAVNLQVTGDTNARLLQQADGKLIWGSGAATGDSVLFRDGANQLGLDNTLLRVYRAAATSATLSTLVTGDANSRFYYQADGKMFWGPGTATQDTNLYRSAADTLTTDDSFTVGGGLTVAGTTWTTYTPTVTGGGSATWTIRTGYYYKLGKLVTVLVYIQVNAAGSGSTPISIDMPSSLDRSTRQALVAQCDNLSASYSGTNSLLSFTGGTGATFDRLRTFDNQNITGAQLAAGALITIQGWYREA